MAAAVRKGGSAGCQACKAGVQGSLSQPPPRTSPHRHLSPTTIAVNISILGLSLYASGWPAMGNCIQLGLPVLILITMFAFHLRRLTVFGLPVFSLFPVFLGLGLTW